jgi:hypothetical protein
MVADNWGAHFDSRVDDLEQRMVDLELIRLAEIHDERDDRVEATEQAVGDLQSWRLELDGYIDDIRYNLHRLNKSHAMQPQQPSLMARHDSAAAALHSGGSLTDWPNGHRVATTTRASDYGSVTTIVLSPANGTLTQPNFDSSQFNPHQQPPPCPPNPPPHIHRHPNPPHPAPPDPLHTQFHPNLGHLPKMHFPKFDGDDPQYWMTCAQNYFDLYAVDPFMWVKCSTMQFTGAARRWFQSVERELMKQDWPNFCRMIRERFCHDQHELLIRQLFHIRQTTTVQDYVDRFVDLIEQLSAYTTSPDHLSYTTQFVDGLRDDIRAIILVQRPKDLDSACTLALLQEEAFEPGRRREARRSEGYQFTRAPAPRGAPPLPSPPVRAGALVN